MEFREISVRQLSRWREGDPEGVWVLDVRQPWEYEKAHLEGSTLIPLGELSGRLGEVPQGVRIACLCHHGMRSARACSILVQRGYSHVYNIKGGIDAWSMQIDTSVPLY